MSWGTIVIILGYIGSAFASIMMIPQVYRTITTKKTEDLSIKMLTLNISAIVLLLPYSIYYLMYPYIITNFSLLICNSIILYYCVVNELEKENT